MKREKTDIVYIAGPMSGIEGFNYPAFHRASAQLRGDYQCKILNPACAPYGLPYRQYMALAIQQILCATAIYLLRGWENSPAARAEKALAEAVGLEIFFEDNDRDHRHE